MNLAFHYLFSLGMAMGPFVLMWLAYRGFEKGVRGADDSAVMKVTEAREQYRAGLRRLAVVSVLALLGLWVWITLAPKPLTSGIHGSLIGVEIGVFHLLWWPLAAPVAVRVAKLTDTLRSTPAPAPGSPVRVASLRVRRVADDLSTTLRAVPFAIGIGAVALLGWRWSTLPAGLDFPWQPLMFAAGAVSALVAYGFWIRMEVRAPQPLVGSGETAKRYQDALEANRRFRVRAVFGLEMLFALGFFGAAYAALEVQAGRISGETVGLVGGIGGSVVGLLGAGFGILGSSRMQQIRTLREQLTKAGALEAESATTN